MAAQQPQQQTPPPEAQSLPTIFRGGVEVVQAPVLVFDRDGNYVNGLQPFQFHLYDNDKEQNINVDVAYQPISMVICHSGQRARGRASCRRSRRSADLVAPLHHRRPGRSRGDRLRFAHPHDPGLHLGPRQDHQSGEGSLRRQQFQPHDRRRCGGDARC